LLFIFLDSKVEDKRFCTNKGENICKRKTMTSFRGTSPQTASKAFSPDSLYSGPDSNLQPPVGKTVYQVLGTCCFVKARLAAFFCGVQPLPLTCICQWVSGLLTTQTQRRQEFRPLRASSENTDSKKG
jgi:hypothetical protein